MGDPKTIVIAGLAVLVGIILGLTAAALPGAEAALREPNAVGALLGTFFAAMIGLGGAAWSALHQTVEGRRRVEDVRRALARELRAEVWARLGACHLAIREITQSQTDNRLPTQHIFIVAAEVIESKPVLERLVGRLGELDPHLPDNLYRFSYTIEALSGLLRLMVSDRRLTPEKVRTIWETTEDDSFRCLGIGDWLIACLDGISSGDSRRPEQHRDALVNEVAERHKILRTIREPLAGNDA